MQLPALCCGAPPLLLAIPRQKRRRPASSAVRRTCCSRCGSSGKRKGIRACETAEDGSEWELPGEESVRAGAPLLASDLPSQRRDRASGGASCPPSDGDASPAAAGRGWRGAAAALQSPQRGRSGAAPELPLSPAESLGAASPELSALLSGISGADGEAEAGTGPHVSPDSPGWRSAAVPPGCPHARHGSGVRGNKLCAKPTAPLLRGFFGFFLWSRFSRWSEDTETPPERSSPSALRALS
ncbi:testis-specific gene A8 protein-like isoform X2 [Motacilla alba alba]|uniref:testis-specific gene A8 protein-like isoform X2 n=1 Tax=Motacilla alba alba TaxID=1094192 RepID=UPI0018D54257|nr:testis-specific gene A8 protein-like isoform X2 [Motacilla alba alba]